MELQIQEIMKQKKATGETVQVKLESEKRAVSGKKLTPEERNRQ